MFLSWINTVDGINKRVKVSQSVIYNYTFSQVHNHDEC